MFRQYTTWVSATPDHVVWSIDRRDGRGGVQTLHVVFGQLGL